MGKGTAIAISLGAFILGGLVGFGVSHRHFSAKLTAYQWTSIETMSDYVMLQRVYSTPAAYESALLEFLQSLDAWDRQHAAGDLITQRALAVDRALTYARLALSASETNRAAVATKYWSQALALCPQIGWTTSCSVDGFTKAVHGLDEASVWRASPKVTSAPRHDS
ncbi:MAG: hypothetical protein JSR67_08910 [Proteobacteria bacterium]|nr:hypothetical protein [Pseudomonadota bacterium]